MEKFGPALQNQSVFQHVMDLCLQSHVGMMLIISGRRWKENALVNRPVSRRAARRRIQMNKVTRGAAAGALECKSGTYFTLSSLHLREIKERLNPQSGVLSVCSNEDIISRSADTPSEDAGLAWFVSNAVIT